MPAARLAMREIKEVLRLKWACALSHRRIAAATGVSVGAVSQYAALAVRAGFTAWEQIEALSETELQRRIWGRHEDLRREVTRGSRVIPEFAWVHRELRRKGVTLHLLWQEYVAANPDAPVFQYTQFTQRYRDWVGMQRRSMRQVHRAGEKLFIDYAGQTVPIRDPGGGADRKAQVFVAVLGASNYTFACATATQSMADWSGAIIAALEFIGGVPQMIVPDNARALIGEPDRYEPQAQRTVADLAAHYGTVVLPARPYRPRDKAKVEVAVQVVERWILARLRNARFFSLMELNHAIARLLTDLNDRPFARLPGNRREWFESLDRPALAALPRARYELARFKTCRVSIDYHVDIDGHYYSVPHVLVGQQVDARVSRFSVEILYRGQRVAAHPVSHKRGAHTTTPEHMPAAHRAHAQWSPSRLIGWGERIGPATAALVRHLLDSKPHPEQGYRACLGLLAAARKYGAARLEAACVRARSIGAMNRRSVLSILAAGLDQQAPLASDADWSTPAHENVRGPTYYH